MAGTDVISIDGVEVESAAIMGRDCAWPITDLRLQIPDDKVIDHFPVLTGWWQDDVEAPSILKQEFNVDTTVIVDNCDSAVVDASLTSCDFVTPNMKLLSLESKELQLEDLLAPMCYQRGVNVQAFADMVFDSNGRVRSGTQYTKNIVRSALAVIDHVMRDRIAYSALRGDAGNLLQVDGLYTQLDGGWTDGSNSCGDTNNLAQSIDWNALTDGSGTASPDDTVGAAKTVTLWGTVYNVPQGINLAQLLERLWMPAVEQNFTRRFGDVQWEMHIRSGEDYCIRNTVTCMQPCSNDSNYDPNVRERWVHFHSTDIMRLMPTGKEFALMQTPQMATNTLRFGPRTIGGNPTYALFFQSLNDYWKQLPRFNNIYGVGHGGAQQDPIILADKTFLQNHFDEMAFQWDVRKTSMKCFKVGQMAKIGVLAMARHLWLTINNVACDTWVDVPASNVKIT